MLNLPLTWNEKILISISAQLSICLSYLWINIEGLFDMNLPISNITTVLELTNFSLMKVTDTWAQVDSWGQSSISDVVYLVTIFRKLIISGSKPEVQWVFTLYLIQEAHYTKII